MANSFSAAAVLEREPPNESLPPAKKYRVQLDFSPKDFEELNALVEELGLPTRAELFRSALIALRWMVQKKRTGCNIVAITPEERFFEPEFDFLQGFAFAAPERPERKYKDVARVAATTTHTPPAKAKTQG